MDKLVIEALWDWARRWHFPFIPLQPSPIRHGHAHWRVFLQTMTPVQHESLVVYISRWNARAGGFAPDLVEDDGGGVWSIQTPLKEGVQV